MLYIKTKDHFLPYMQPATVKVDMVVPMKAKVKMAPMLRKKKRFFILYPAWNIMGGKRILKKISGSNVAFWSMGLAASRTSPLKL